MKEELRKKIQKNYIALKRDMDAKDLVDYFIQEDLLDHKDVERINGYNPNTSDSRNTCFFSIILAKEDRAYDVFLATLREIGLDHLAELVENTTVVAQATSDEEPGAWITQIPESARTRRLVEKDLSKIAQTIGSDWEVVASELGLSKVDVDHLKMENHTVTMQIYGALYKWRNRVVNKATLEEVVKILKECQCTSIDWAQLQRVAKSM